MRRLFAIVTILLFLPLAGPSRLAPVPELTGGAIGLTATPITFARRNGELTYLRGWRLTSTSREFGGLSALRAWHGRWLAVLDTGGLLIFSPHERVASLSPVAVRCGPDRVRLGRDLEGLDTDGTRVWVSSEWHNAICRIAPGRISAGIRPAAMADWPRYSGAETLLRLRDGRFLVMPENFDFAALLFPRDPVSGAAPAQLHYRPPPGYRPTDAAELPDGRIVILNRRLGWRGFATTLVLFDGLPSRGIAQGRTIATIRHGNFEGIAARREGGATILTIVSDDNYSQWQETLLLEFRLNG